VFPEDWKNAVIKQLLKKKGPALELENYHRVSNLTFLANILEKAVLNQIAHHIESDNLLPSYQSAESFIVLKQR
jgi:lambda repressor-like predicted transcriptional regulator